MSTKSRIYWSFAGILLIATWIMFRPIDDPVWQITTDQDKIKAKKTWLEYLRAQRDTSFIPPNIVLILADDLGFTDISINGGLLVETPNIDKLADEGVNFINAYSTSPICAPSRAAIMTGRYQNRFGFVHQMQNRYPRNRLEVFGARRFIDSHPWEIRETTSVPDPSAMLQQGLPAGEITMAEALQWGRGYITACIGKWHLGKTRGKFPGDLGFDTHYGFYNSHSLYAPEESPGITDHKIDSDWTDPFIWQSQRKGLSAIVRDGQEIKEDGYLTDRIAEESVKFISENKDQPFFLYVPFSAPHTPLQAPDSLVSVLSPIDDPVKRVYNAMILSLDMAVGKIMEAIDENGLDDNTLIVFTSDNGGAHYTMTTDNGPFKAGKTTFFEGGIRVPMVLKYGSMYNGIEYRGLVSTMDVFTTALRAAEIPVPHERKIDGLDLVSLVGGQHKSRESLHWAVSDSHAIIHDGYKLIRTGKKPVRSRLYYIRNDPFEITNLKEEEKEKAVQMWKDHLNWLEEMSAPLWPGVVRFKELDDGEWLYFDS